MDRNLFLALTLSATFQCLAQTPEPFEVRRAEAVFEELPSLKRERNSASPNFSAARIMTFGSLFPRISGMNQFTIDSDFGVFEANGNEMLVTRIKEINAIARLKEVSRTDEFKNALTCGEKSARSAKNIVTDPAQHDFECAKRSDEIHEARQARASKNVGNKSASHEAEGSRMQQLIGLFGRETESGAQSRCRSLQHQHRATARTGRIAWASFAGGMTVQLATMPIVAGRLRSQSPILPAPRTTCCRKNLLLILKR